MRSWRRHQTTRQASRSHINIRDESYTQLNNMDTYGVYYGPGPCAKLATRINRNHARHFGAVIDNLTYFSFALHLHNHRVTQAYLRDEKPITRHIPNFSEIGHHQQNLE